MLKFLKNITQPNNLIIFPELGTKIIPTKQQKTKEDVKKINLFLSSELDKYITQNQSLRYEIKKLKRANEKISTAYMEKIDEICKLETRIQPIER